MPIEFWWWIKPLFFTGFIVLFITAIIAWVLDKFSDRSWVDVLSAILAGIAFVPWFVCGISTIAWFFANCMILIWRR